MLAIHSQKQAGELHIEVKDTQVGDVPRTFQLSWLGSLLLALLPLLVCCCFCCCGLLWLLLLLLLWSFVVVVAVVVVVVFCGCCCCCCCVCSAKTFNPFASLFTNTARDVAWRSRPHRAKASQGTQPPRKPAFCRPAGGHKHILFTPIKMLAARILHISEPTRKA